MSMGTGPFGTTGVGVPIAELPAADRATIASSRKIDPETMTYVENDEGGFEEMNDSLQRVLLTIAINVKEPKIIDDRFQPIMEARIRKALAFMTTGPEPAIKINSISVTNDGKSGTTKVVDFYDYRSATTQIAKAG